MRCMRATERGETDKNSPCTQSGCVQGEYLSGTYPFTAFHSASAA